LSLDPYASRVGADAETSGGDGAPGGADGGFPPDADPTTFSCRNSGAGALLCDDFDQPTAGSFTWSPTEVSPGALFDRTEAEALSKPRSLRTFTPAGATPFAKRNMVTGGVQLFALAFDLAVLVRALPADAEAVILHVEGAGVGFVDVSLLGDGAVRVNGQGSSGGSPKTETSNAKLPSGRWAYLRVTLEDLGSSSRINVAMGGRAERLGPSTTIGSVSKISFGQHMTVSPTGPVEIYFDNLRVGPP
jgi:hypothetical protein